MATDTIRRFVRIVVGTIVAWSLLVVALGIAHVRSRLAMHGIDDTYAGSASFQIVAFLLLRMPGLLVALMAVLACEGLGFWILSRRRPPDPTGGASRESLPEDSGRGAEGTGGLVAKTQAVLEVSGKRRGLSVVSAYLSWYFVTDLLLAWLLGHAWAIIWIPLHFIVNPILAMPTIALAAIDSFVCFRRRQWLPAPVIAVSVPLVATLAYFGFTGDWEIIRFFGLSFRE